MARKTRAEKLAEARAAQDRVYRTGQILNNLARIRQKLENEELDVYDIQDLREEYTEECLEIDTYERFFDDEGFYRYDD